MALKEHKGRGVTSVGGENRRSSPREVRQGDKGESPAFGCRQLEYPSARSIGADYVDILLGSAYEDSRSLVAVN